MLTSVLAILALVGCVTAILVLAIQPTAARLQGDIGLLNARLSATQSRLAALQAATAHVAHQGSRLTKDIHHLSRHVAGLQRTVHGLQGAATMTREQTLGLRVCFAQLHQELAGMSLKTRSAHGRVTSVGLADSATPSPACGAVFSGA